MSTVQTQRFSVLLAPLLGNRKTPGFVGYRKAPFLKLCVPVAVRAHVLTVDFSMDSCQAILIIPSMNDLRTFTKASKITGLGSQQETAF